MNIVQKLKPICFFFFIMVFWSIPALSQPVVHHELMVELIPVENKIRVIDKIDLTALKDKRDFDDRPLVFMLHAGNSIKVVEKNIKIQKVSFVDAKKYYANLSARSLGEGKVEMRVGMVPVDVYAVDFPPEQKQLTLEYERKIHHAIESGEKEYARSISTSSGIIDERGVFIAKESFWFPVFSNELLTFNLSVRSPTGWKSVSQGERLYSDNNSTSHMDTWQELKPQDDMYLVAAKFKEYSQSAGPVKAMAFLRTPDDALAQKYLDITAQYLEMYSRLLGPYPYSKFALVENFWETGFGMPSFTLLGSKIIRFPFILHTSYPHELLHNWWGNSVYVDYDGGNWAEGLTSYLADHLVKEQRGKGRDYRRTALQKYTNFANPENDFSLATFVSRYDDVTAAVGYGKTLMLFHMLRQKIGDEYFVRGLQRLYREYRYKAAGYQEIEAIFSQVSNRNLTSFFSQWVHRIGAPSLALTHASMTSSSSGEYQVKATVSQTQEGEAYQLSVPVVVTFDGGRQVERILIKMSEKNQQIALTFNDRPVRLDIDPEFDVFRRLDINETPPALSQAFGAKESLIILPSVATVEKRKAYEKLAKTWQVTQQSQMTIKYDNQITVLPKGKTIWVLGWENKYRTSIDAALQRYDLNEQGEDIYLAGKSIPIKNHSFVFVGRNKMQESQAMVFIATDNAAAISGLGRKLPHYGRYSYLSFEGDEPNNMAKGQWPIIGSPLSALFVKNAKMPVFSERSPLATLSPVFSENNLMNHVRHLASEEMMGRGLGGTGIDKAADYIAASFRDSGLMSLLPEDSFFQDWMQPIDGELAPVRVRNVVAYLPGTNSKLKEQPVIVSAHYDHFGLGERLSRKGNEGLLHYGADDNASGVSVMLALASVFAKSGGFSRPVIFVAFSGEEDNRLGSRYFVKNMPVFSAKNIFAVVNMDSVGRLEGKPLMVFGTNSASEWVHVFRGIEFVTGIKIKSPSQEFSGSDEASFHEVDVPAVQFFSGVNADFHRPSDTVDKIDSEGLVKVAVVAKETIAYLAEREQPLTNLLKDKATQVKPTGRPTTGRRVSLGTVPDFSYQGEGVLISSVVPNSPAAKAKVEANDVLIAVDGKKVKGLREFSHILRQLKPGDEVVLTLSRNGEVIKVSAKLVAR